LPADDDDVAALRVVEKDWQVAARPVQMRLDDLQREAGGDGGVERVATALQHRHACGRREPVRGRDHAERAAQLRSRRELHAARL
jgi:hypothetical protein